ncbi:hypothetical protein FPV67DRAFT_1453358 [Lyophyllum atratum]|nr:hypothetical protein FPV67DRAFT_1453358 [Lyophyllum atratum]
MSNSSQHSTRRNKANFVRDIYLHMNNGCFRNEAKTISICPDKKQKQHKRISCYLGNAFGLTSQRQYQYVPPPHGENRFRRGLNIATLDVRRFARQTPSFIGARRRPVPAAFDHLSPSSSVPQALITSLGFPGVTGSVSLPLTVSLDSVFNLTTVQNFDISLAPHLILGLDWFAGFRDHLLASELQPPIASVFDLHNFVPVSLMLPRHRVNPGLPVGTHVETPVVPENNDLFGNEPCLHVPRPSPVLSDADGLAGCSTYVAPNIGLLVGTMLDRNSPAFALSPFDSTVLKVTVEDRR